MAPKQLPAYQVIDGLRVSTVFTEEMIRDALNFKTGPGDVVLATFPKCGTHWLQQIVQLIMNKGRSANDWSEFWNGAPVLEMGWAKALEKISPPRVMQTHIPLHRLRFNPATKYVYLVRNPKDCCVSFFHHTRMLPEYQFQDGSFDDFFRLFLKGETDHGDYFDHVMSWYKHKDDPNVFLCTYEDLKKHTRDVVLKLAHFLGEDYGKLLEENEDVITQVLERSSVQFMKDAFDLWNQKLERAFAKDSTVIPEGMKKFLLDESGKFAASNLVRKGEVGNWKTLFTADHTRRLQERIDEKTKGSDVMSLWANHGQPHVSEAERQKAR